MRATSESVSDPDLVRAAASHRGTASAASVNGSVEPGRLRRLPFCWLCGSAGMSEPCSISVGSASAGGGLANRCVCTRGRMRRAAPYRALQSMGHGIHEAVPRLQGRWGALDVLPRPRLLMGSVEGSANGFHHRGEIAAGWVCGSGLRSFRTRAKVFLDAG